MPDQPPMAERKPTPEEILKTLDDVSITLGEVLQRVQRIEAEIARLDVPRKRDTSKGPITGRVASVL